MSHIPASPEPPDSDLARSLTRRQMTMLGLGSAIGTGLFLGAGASISVAGPAVIVSYTIGAVLATIVALALAEMTSALPIRGSFGAIAARCLGPLAGFTVRWIYWFALVIGIGSEVVAAAIYVNFWWPAIPIWASVVVFSLLLTAVNFTHVRLFGTMESVLASVKVFAILVFILLGVILVVFGLPGRAATGVGNLTAHGGFLPNGPGAVWLVMAIVVFSFAGIELVAISAPEAEEPGRAVRSAMRSLIGRLSLFYLVAIFLMLAVQPWTELSQTHGVDGSPFVAMFASAGIPAAATITNLVLLVTALSAGNANLYAAARMIHSLAHDGFAPKPLRRTTRQGLPRAATLASTAGLLVAAVLAVYTGQKTFGILLALGAFGIIATWITILITLLVFRRGTDARHSSIRLRGGPILPLLGIAGLLSVFGTGIFVDNMRLACLVGFPFVVVVGIVYAAFFRRRIESDTAGGPTPIPDSIQP
ncbi:amino acid permease [Amycolatopsis japonica]